ncbi:MAG: phosphatidate cytidylyltransferase [Bacteroidales bacterium]|nr:phosphatidate cytidylyltransferase [Bacteroidales bacterium]
MNNLIIRALTGALFVAVLLTSLWVGSYAFLILFGFIVFLGTFEVVALVAEKQKPGFALFCAFIALLVFWLASGSKFPCWSFLPPEYSADAFILLFFIPIVGLFLKSDSKVKLIAAGLCGTILLSISFTALATIFASPNGYVLTLAFFCTIWTYDTFAYLTGSAIGRRRMCEAISPKKSWEGAVGGLVFAVGCGSIFFWITGILALWQWILYAVIICVFGTIGDFCESLLKRSVHAKDSGKILPRHGGILDRFDSAIFAIPFVLLYLQILKQVLL